MTVPIEEAPVATVKFPARHAVEQVIVMVPVLPLFAVSNPVVVVVTVVLQMFTVAGPQSLATRIRVSQVGVFIVVVPQQ